MVFTKIWKRLMKRNGISDLDLHQLISIVEWWENDSLDINSYQHVLFVFKEYWSDILVTDKISTKSTNDFQT